METERLTVFPLTVRQLELLLSDLPALEREAELTYDAEPIEGFMREYLADQIRIIKDDPNQWLYTALWLIVRKQDRVAVGSIAFKGKPDDQGIVEIGYGLSPQYEHNGYMTEAAGALTDWALTQDQVYSVIAQTDLDGSGPASQRILRRLGYTRYRFGEESWWRKAR